MARWRLRVASVVGSLSLLFLLAGCPAGGGSQPDAGGSDGGQVARFEPAPPAMRRLTRAQYLSTVRDLLGIEVALSVDLEPDTPLNGFASIGAARITIPTVAVERFEAAALTLADAAMSPEVRGRLVPCTPQGVWDAACAETFLRAFGRRAFRRPLDEAQL